jgi:hypothetical protein
MALRIEPIATDEERQSCAALMSSTDELLLRKTRGSWEAFQQRGVRVV